MAKMPFPPAAAAAAKSGKKPAKGVAKPAPMAPSPMMPAPFKKGGKVKAKG